MSLFRKPKKIQRRVFCADDDEDGDPEAPPPPIISQNKKEDKPVKGTTLLSFADEEEETEVFKVKKSSQSKRLAKRREKEKKRGPDGDNNKYDSKNNEEKPSNGDNGEEKPKAKKKVTLEGLILSGRAALAADGAGDVSDDSEPEPEDEDSRGFHQYRAESVRAALAVAPGHIPDAALIHAARKTRQQARELGGDYVPIRSDSTPGSRLIRDDGSCDEDEEEGRLHVRGLDLPSDKPKRETEAAAPDVEMDSGGEEWEEQQMQKAMAAITDVTVGMDMGSELNPFSVVPPPPQLQAAPAHLRPLLAAHRPPTTAQELVDALTLRLSELTSGRESTASKQEEYRERLLSAARVRESRAARCAQLDAAYRRAQAARGYLTDLIECLDEKMPMIESLESRALMLHRRRCEFVMERRRADVSDQAQDVLALAGRTGAKPVESEEKVRRVAEREGRRRARRLRREAAAASAGTAPRHTDGDSSDEDLPPHEKAHYTNERDAIRKLSASVFADALPAWRSVAGVCARLARWRRRDPVLYADAYVAECLPKLIAPYIRHQLILWNPLAEEDNDDYERMDWYKCLMMYGVRSEKVPYDSEESDDEDLDVDEEAAPVTENSVRDDQDLMLVPSIINGVILPKLTELVEVAWDPVCVRACVQLRQLLVRVGLGPGSSASLGALAVAARSRLQQALNADVFLPALPPHVMEGSGGAFWRRCLGAGVRLVRAALALTAPPEMLHADPIVLSLIDTLCTGAGAAPGKWSASAAAALSATLPRSGPLRARALRRLAKLAQLAISRLQADNPLHYKALEQAKNVLAEAKAAEAAYKE